MATSPIHMRLAPAPPRSGAQILSRAEFRLARRRRLTLLLPVSLLCLAADVHVVAARHAGWTAGFMVRTIDALLVTAWFAALVAGTFAAALKPKPVRAGAIACVVAGPVLCPMVFGHGWQWWTTTILVLLCAVAVAPRPIAR